MEAPRIAIGLPVYNNGKYLRKTLDSILNQSYRNFILLLSDDGSTDETEEICEQYAKLDTRIKYTKNATNLGAMGNHRKVLEDAETEYFMFARGHEILPPDLLEDCLHVLENDTEVVLAFAKTVWIDEEDNILNNKYLPYYDSRGCDVVTRFVLVLWGRCEYFYGLVRTEHLKSIRVLENVIATDLIMLIEMALLGSFAHIESGVRKRRYHYNGESYRQRIKRYQENTLINPSIIDRFFPFAKLPFMIFSSVIRSKISITSKIFLIIIAIMNAPLKFMLSRGEKL